MRAGLQPGEVYWVTSGPAGPSMHLPLGADGAVAWYFSTHRGSSDPLRRLVGRLLQVLSAGRGRRLGRLVPTFAVTARRPSGGELEPARSATALPAARLPGWPTGTDVRPIMLAGGDGPWSRTVLLPFAGGSREPSVVIKIARSSAYARTSSRSRRSSVDWAPRSRPICERACPSRSVAPTSSARRRRSSPIAAVGRSGREARVAARVEPPGAQTSNGPLAGFVRSTRRPPVRRRASTPAPWTSRGWANDSLAPSGAKSRRSGCSGDSTRAYGPWIRSCRS